MSLMPFEVSIVQKEQVLFAREQRMKNALKMVSKEILDTLQKLKLKDIKLGQQGWAPFFLKCLKRKMPNRENLSYT